MLVDCARLVRWWKILEAVNYLISLRNIQFVDILSCKARSFLNPCHFIKKSQFDLWSLVAKDNKDVIAHLFSATLQVTEYAKMLYSPRNTDKIILDENR